MSGFKRTTSEWSTTSSSFTASDDIRQPARKTLHYFESSSTEASSTSDRCGDDRESASSGEFDDVSSDGTECESCASRVSGGSAGFMLSQAAAAGGGSSDESLQDDSESITEGSADKEEPEAVSSESDNGDDGRIGNGNDGKGAGSGNGGSAGASST